jgi:glycosyltransferase involved in cell wall biosynthesis
LKEVLGKARALVYAAVEDFGIVPLEAQACGTPVIAFGKGGVLETVIDGQTGLLYEEQTQESLAAAVERFEKSEIHLDPQVLRRHAERFGKERFKHEITHFVELKWGEFRNSYEHARTLV